MRWQHCVWHNLSSNQTLSDCWPVLCKVFQCMQYAFYESSDATRNFIWKSEKVLKQAYGCDAVSRKPVNGLPDAKVVVNQLNMTLDPNWWLRKSRVWWVQTVAWLCEDLQHHASWKIEHALSFSKVCYSFDDRIADEKSSGRLMKKAITGDDSWVYDCDIKKNV